MQYEGRTFKEGEAASTAVLKFIRRAIGFGNIGRGEYIGHIGRIEWALALFVFAGTLLSGCTLAAIGEAGRSNLSDNDNQETIVSDNELKAGGRAVFLGADKEELCVRFVDVQTGEHYELDYDAKTAFEDSYGGIMVVDEFQIGDVVDLIVSVHSGIINSMKLSGDTFSLSGIGEYTINQNKGVFSADG